MFDFLEFDDFLLEQELIDEATDDGITKAESELTNMMQHMIKHQYQPSRQGKSWCDSIGDSYNLYNKIVNKNAKSKKNIEKGIDLDKCYKDARKEALKQTNLPQSTIPKDKPSELDINYMTDYDKIISFLKDNYNQDATYNFKSKEDMEDFMISKLKEI